MATASGSVRRKRDCPSDPNEPVSLFPLEPSGWAAGWNDPAPKANVWRYKPSDGTVQKWALPDAVGMNGPIAAIVPLTDQVLFLISGHGAASANPRATPWPQGSWLT